MTKPRRILITGAGRGLGLEFTKRWLADGREVCALARDPEGSPGLASLKADYGESLHLVRCDVGDEASVQAARGEVTAFVEGLDLIVNNAGTYGPRGETLGSVSFDEIRRVFEVNTLAPIRVAKAFVPLLMQGEAPRIVQMTSLMGSIADNGSGGSWSYRLSKAALNMMTKNLSHELAQSAIPCICIHPGWVRTDMGGPKAPLSIGESVAALIDTIDALSMEHSGAFLDRDGKPLPW